MRPSAVLVTCLLLAGCGAAKALPPPGVVGTVVVNVWDPDIAQPTVIVADRIVQQGAGFDQLRLDNVRSRVVQKDMDLAVTSPSGTLSTRSGLLILAGPVHFAGTWQSHPVLGIGSSAGLSRDGAALSLEQPEIWHQGERLRAPYLELHRDRTIVAPRGLDSDPLPPEQAAAFAALPDPLVLSR